MAAIIAIGVNTALVLYFISSIFYFSGMKTGRKVFLQLGTITAITGAAGNLIALIARTLLSGRLPLTDGYEFLLSFTCITVLLYLGYEKMSSSKSSGAVLMLIIAILLVSVHVLMPDQHGTVGPLMPALKSPWLAGHVLTAAMAYSLFALGAALAVVQLTKKPPQGSVSRPKILFDKGQTPVDCNVYRTVAAGFVMLSISIVLGGIWAEQVWGTYWSWDPKETWALITWIIYAIYLHIYRKKKWKGNNANLMVVAGFFLVLFTFFGVNYLLSGLHSYAAFPMPEAWKLTA